MMQKLVVNLSMMLSFSMSSLQSFLYVNIQNIVFAFNYELLHFVSISNVTFLIKCLRKIFSSQEKIQVKTEEFFEPLIVNFKSRYLLFTPN
jgi:hypothetical protein